MDVTASESEERGFASPSGGVSLDHVTKEQLYAAYRRTQERYGKYRTRYTDLARHYKFLERENAKAKVCTKITGFIWTGAVFCRFCMIQHDNLHLCVKAGDRISTGAW